MSSSKATPFPRGPSAGEGQKADAKPVRDRKSIFVELEEARQRGEAVALVTILKTEGSTPQKTEAKMVVGRDARLRGTVGGGCVEEEILQRAQRAIEKRECEMGSYDFNADEFASEILPRQDFQRTGQSTVASLSEF